MSSTVAAPPPTPVIIEPLTLEAEVLWALRFGPLTLNAIIEFLDGRETALSVQDCVWDLGKTARARFSAGGKYSLVETAPHC